MLRKLRRQWSGRWIRFTPLVPSVRGRWYVYTQTRLSHLSVPVLRLSPCVNQYVSPPVLYLHSHSWANIWRSILFRVHLNNQTTCTTDCGIFCNTTKFRNLVGNGTFCAFEMSKNMVPLYVTCINDQRNQAALTVYISYFLLLWTLKIWPFLSSVTEN